MQANAEYFSAGGGILKRQKHSVPETSAANSGGLSRQAEKQAEKKGEFMDFLHSQTMQNLARSFAGESQARNRYTFYAQQARREGQEYLAGIFEQTADNEKVHAEEFWELLTKHAGKQIDNIGIDAGYPFSYGNTGENLQFAAQGEQAENEMVYPQFARIASEEGYEDAARLWRLIATVEGLHYRTFMQAREEYLSGTLYRRGEPVAWRCMNCGYTYRAKEAAAQCPVCGKDKGWTMGYVDDRRLPGSG